MTTMTKALVLAAGVMVLGLSCVAAGPYAAAPDAGDKARAAVTPHHAKRSVGCSGPSITVAGATLCGIAGARPNIDAYEGITYANQTRWQNSTITPPVSGNANAFGNICYQNKAPYGKQWPPMAENCLNLNVWMPHGAAAGSLPVMVFIHGGAFVSGHGSSPTYDGSALAQQGVVVVTLNYRLGALGFLSSNDGTVNAPGNMGLVDQQNALTWVQTYISAFGGNPAQVTIFGESAGAMSVGLHLFSAPGSDKLFNAAMMESNPMGNVYNTKTQFDPAGATFLKDLCAIYHPFQTCDATWFNTTVSPEHIVAEQDVFVPSGVSQRGIGWAPVIDDQASYPQTVLGHPYAGYATGTHAKPFVFGINQDEGVLFAAIAGGSSNAPSKDLYENTLLKDAFGAANVSAILGYPAYNISTGAYCYLPKYKHTKQNPFCYYSPWGQSYANVLTDYMFATGNLVAAMKSQGAFIPPVFTYAFTQAPIFDQYPLKTDHGACLPVPLTTHVCHGNELPYVFNTLASVVNGAVPGSDQTLADRMTQDWASFAKQPLAPGADWTKFSGTLTTTATIFGNNTVTPGGAFFPTSNETFWQGFLSSSGAK